MSTPRNVGEAFRPLAGDLKVAPTANVPFEPFAQLQRCPTTHITPLLQAQQSWALDPLALDEHLDAAEASRVQELGEGAAAGVVLFER